ncbi:MAG: glycosyltransferase [Deferrisomatales bacterium]|nr:glycosyltransferase [Deferrisomatales bacterium]
MPESLEFSIVIPTKDRPRQLVACLEALAGLAYPSGRFEVVVVDDGSRMALAPVLDPFLDRLELTVLRQQNAGPAGARNTGAAKARGRFLAFTDDDCTPAEDWLQRLATRLETVPHRLIGGRTINALADNVFSESSQLLIDYLYRYYNADPDDARFFASNNVACSAEAFRKLGGFDPKYPRAAAEDRDLCDRWLQSGTKLAYAPEAVVYHYHRLGLRSFCRQHFGYGRGAFHYHRGRSLRLGDKFRIEPFGFYLGLVGYPIRQHSIRRSLLFTVLLILSQAANAAGYFWERWGPHRSEPDGRAAGTSGRTADLVKTRKGRPDPRAGGSPDPTG